MGDGSKRWLSAAVLELLGFSTTDGARSLVDYYPCRHHWLIKNTQPDLCETMIDHFGDTGSEDDSFSGDVFGDVGSELVDWDQLYMRQALGLAEQAMEEDEVPVGAIITHRNRVIGAGWNQREALSDPTAHAEMIAITQAAASLSSWRLEDCTLYVTLEPCPMCAGAILQSRLPRIVYGATDPKAGAVDSLYRLLDDPRLNHRSEVTGGVMAEQCGAILSHFFRLKRAQGKK